MTLTPLRVHLCSISPGEQDDCGSHGDLEGRGGPRDAVMYLGTSAHSSRSAPLGCRSALGSLCVRSCLPRFVLVGDWRAVPSWAAVQGSLVVPAHLCASGSNAGSGKEG